MRHVVDAVGPRRRGAGERPVVRGDHVEDRPLVVLQEDGGHLARAAPHEDGLGPQVDAVGVGNVHPATDVQERDALPVDGDLDLLRLVEGVERTRSRPHDRAGGLVVEGHPEPVLAVRREHVVHHDAAPGPVGRTLDLAELGGPAGHVVARLGGRRVGITDREPADVAGGAQVGVHEGRRQQLDVGDVVEVGADRVLGEVLGSVQREVQQIADGRGVLRPVQALEGPASGVRIRGGALVELGLERLRDLGQRLFGRTPGAGRRHHPEPELGDHLLREDRIRRSVRGVETGERHVAGLHPVVVADHAVGPQHPVVRGGASFPVGGESPDAGRVPSGVQFRTDATVGGAGSEPGFSPASAGGENANPPTPRDPAATRFRRRMGCCGRTAAGWFFRPRIRSGPIDKG